MSFVLVGLGGIGNHVLRNLAPYVRSQGGGDIIGIDGDTFELKNKDRQQFKDLGKKAEVLCAEVAAMYDGVTILPIAEYVTPENVEDVIDEGDIVFCMPDNHKTRSIIEKRCQVLDDVLLLSGGNDGIEDGNTGTYGNVQVYLRRGGQDITNTISAYHRELKDPQDKLPTELGCGEQVDSAPQLLFTNMQVATTMLSAYHAYVNDQLDYEEVFFDILPQKMGAVQRKIKERKP